MVSILVNRGFFKRRANTTWPIIRSLLRLTAAKLMRTWNAIRVFSGMTRTRPQRLTSLVNSRNRLTAWGVLPARCCRKLYCEQKCDWFRFAKSRLHFGHCHSPSARMTREYTAAYSFAWHSGKVMRICACPGYFLPSAAEILTTHTSPACIFLVSSTCVPFV